MKLAKTQEQTATRTESEIDSIKKELLSMEATDHYFLDEKLRTLRHMVLYIHMRIETSMEILIFEDMKKITREMHTDPNLFTGPATVKDAGGLYQRLIPIFGNLDFTKKLNICETRELIPSKKVSKIRKVNNHRNHFAHPKTYREEVEVHKTPQKYLQTLKDLKIAVGVLDKALTD